MKIDLARISEATRLVRAGQLHAATEAIQAALGGQAHPRGAATSASAGASDTVIDVLARVVSRGDPVSAHPPAPQARDTACEPSAHYPSPAGEAGVPKAAGRFMAGSFGNGRDRRDYKLFVPADAGEGALPLVVMLHGCTQDPDDFAAGTGMNELANARGCYVLYPAQSRQANPQGCWNWFKHSHQERGRGEPALLAAMTRHVMAQHHVDPRRVYVAGLSAGGAMAAILGDTHPDLYAAVGVHSGLASGSARDLPSALAAMKQGSVPVSKRPSGVPTIVFHGDADATVHLRNGEHVIAACVDAGATIETTVIQDAGARKTTRAIYRQADGWIIAERWTVHGTGHAWSGGTARGSYTDGRGPDASSEMLRFFLEHPRVEDPLQEQPEFKRRA